MFPSYQAIAKKKLIAEGKLDPHGRVNDKTPTDFKNNYVYYKYVTGSMSLFIFK
jgi:hypothetical protein